MPNHRVSSRMHVITSCQSTAFLQIPTVEKLVVIQFTRKSFSSISLWGVFRLWVEIAMTLYRSIWELEMDHFLSLSVCVPLCFWLFLFILFCASAQWGLLFSTSVCPSPIYSFSDWAKIIELVAKLHLFLRSVIYSVTHESFFHLLSFMYINWFLCSSNCC